MKPQRGDVQQVARTQDRFYGFHPPYEAEPLHVSLVTGIDLSLGVAWMKEGVRVETGPVGRTKERESLNPVELRVEVVIPVVVAVGDYVGLPDPGVYRRAFWVGQQELLDGLGFGEGPLAKLVYIAREVVITIWERVIESLEEFLRRELHVSLIPVSADSSTQ